MPVEVAITCNGRYAYVVDNASSSVSVVDLQTNQNCGVADRGSHRDRLGFDHAGRQVCLRRRSRLQGRTGDRHHDDQVVGSPIALAGKPGAIAFTPTATMPRSRTRNRKASPPRPTVQAAGRMADPGGLRTRHDRHDTRPTAPRLLLRPRWTGPTRVPVAFNASASSHPDGTIARFDWAFGDGQTVPGGGPTPSHTYRSPGTYKAALTLTDNEGCSTAVVFTGQTAYCNGRASAAQTQTIKVAYPGVRVKCPTRAKAEGCRFKLQAVTKRRRGRAESAVTRVKLKAGKSKIVALRPKKKFGSGSPAPRRFWFARRSRSRAQGGAATAG